MIKLKQIVENKLYGLTIQEVLDKFLKFEGKTLIFFDTETLGLDPTVDYVQLTEIGAISINGSTFETIDTFRLKAKLDDKAKNVIKKQESEPDDPTGKKKKLVDLLKMTQYHDVNSLYFGEDFILKQFTDWINKFDNPLLIAHNARFDMKFISQRGMYFGYRLQKYNVLDTLKIAKLFFIPALQSLSDLNNENAKDMILKLTTNNRISASLGVLSPALNVDIKNWHSAIADVQSMFEVLKKIIEFLKNNSDLNIRKHHEKAVKSDIEKHTHN